MSDRLFEHAVLEWLENGSDQTPQTAIDAVLLAVKTTPQQRVLRIPRRFIQMPVLSRATAVATVAILAVFGAGGALLIANRPPGPGASPSPTLRFDAPTSAPTTAPSAPAATVTSFTSTRYDYEIQLPAGWTATEADHDWMPETDGRDRSTSGTDSFVGPGGHRITGFSGPATGIPWGLRITGFLMPCSKVGVEMPLDEVDGYPVLFWKGGGDASCSMLTAFVHVGLRMYVFTQFGPYDETLLAQVVSTVTFSRQLVGTWARTATCDEAVAAFRAAGLDDQINEWVVANVFGEGTTRAPGTECTGAPPPQEHSHFFTAQGRFGSLDANGTQVDDGAYGYVDGGSLSFPDHAREFGFNGEILVAFTVTDDVATFAVHVPTPCESSCRKAYAWALSAFFGPREWERK